MVNAKDLDVAALWAKEKALLANGEVVIRPVSLALSARRLWSTATTPGERRTARATLKLASRAVSEAVLHAHIPLADLVGCVARFLPAPFLQAVRDGHIRRPLRPLARLLSLAVGAPGRAAPFLRRLCDSRGEREFGEAEELQSARLLQRLACRMNALDAASALGECRWAWREVPRNARIVCLRARDAGIAGSLVAVLARRLYGEHVHPVAALAALGPETTVGGQSFFGRRENALAAGALASVLGDPANTHGVAALDAAFVPSPGRFRLGSGHGARWLPKGTVPALALSLAEFARWLRRAVLKAGQDPRRRAGGPVPVEEVAAARECPASAGIPKPVRDLLDAELASGGKRRRAARNVEAWLEAKGQPIPRPLRWLAITPQSPSAAYAAPPVSCSPACAL